LRWADEKVTVTDASMSWLSRRHFLGLIPAAVVLASCSDDSSNSESTRNVPDSGPVRNVRDFGALGNGKHDDSDAISKAVAEMKSGDVLRFPPGTYRFAQRDPSGDAAIIIAGISDVAVEFDDGAELLMDNLDDDGAGTSHGIVVRGPVSGIALRNVKVRWAEQPAQRSFGDGIRVVGYPSDSTKVPEKWTGSDGPATGVSLSNCRIESSPQAGVIMMGVSDITVADLHIENTMADGLHFNACRRGQITNYSATNPGDDGLALVTYYSKNNGFDNDAETFSFPELNDWSNADFTITDVVVAGGAANGVRLAGAGRSTINSVAVRGVRDGSGVVVDSASVDSDAEWDYVASRGVNVSGLTVESSETGLHVLARPEGSADDRFSRFDVTVSGMTVRDCPRWSVLVESIADQPVTGVRVDDCTITAGSIDDDTGIVGLQTTRDISLGNLSIESSAPSVAFSANSSTRFQLDQLRVTVTGPGPDPESAGAFAQFQVSSGTIASAELNWADAPASWTPVSMNIRGCTDGSPPDDLPVTIDRLATQPRLVTDPVQLTCS
jgi:hypothetical protein